MIYNLRRINYLYFMRMNDLELMRYKWFKNFGGINVL